MKNHLRLAPALFLALPLGALGSLAAEGCSITTVTSTNADAGTSSSSNDAGGLPGVDSSPGTVGSGDSGALPLGFTPSNFGAILGTLDLSKLADLDVTGTQNDIDVSCNSNPGCVSASIIQPDQSTLVLYIAKSWRIEPSAHLAVTDKTAVAMVATGAITIAGRLEADATGQFTVGGGVNGGSTVGGVAGGPGGGALGAAPTQTVIGIGGGGASFCGKGGAGGNATATVGAPGATFGTATLIPLVPGSAGGGAELASGAGGGAIQIVSGTSITIEAAGIVSVGGGGGGNGSPGAGGGSGGALLLEAPLVTVAGTLAANGGGGGSLAAGADGTPNATAAAGGSASTDGAGGSGSAGATTAGSAGAIGDPPGGNNGAGGGGGGSGFIRINSASGAATLGGTLSPAAGSVCLSQGTLGH